MFRDDLIRFSSFENSHLTFENTGTTLTNKAFLINAILDTIFCILLIVICGLTKITATSFGRISISNEFTIFKKINIAKIVIVKKI